MNEKNQMIPELEELVKEHPLPKRGESAVRREKEQQFEKAFHEAAKEGLRLHRANSPGALEKIVSLGQQLRLRIAEHVECVAGQLSGGFSEPLGGTRSASPPSPSPAPPNSDAVILSVTNEIVGQIVVRPAEDGKISLALSVLDEGENPLSSFRYTVAAQGHGVVGDMDRVLSGGRNVALDSIPFTNYQIILEREDGSSPVTLEFGPEE